MTTIVSPRPPLNLFSVERATLSSSMQTVYRTPRYQIPAVGPNPARDIEAVALLTSLIITNTMEQSISVFINTVEFTDQGSTEWELLKGLVVPKNDFALIELSKQNLPSDHGIRMRVSPGQSAVAHLSFVLNQREEYEVIT